MVLREVFGKLAERVDGSNTGMAHNLLNQAQQRFGNNDNNNNASSQGQFGFPGNNSQTHTPFEFPHMPHHGESHRRAVYPQPGLRHAGPGQLPPKVKETNYHGKMRFYHPAGHEHKIARDLGFTGVLDGKVVWTWGDTLMMHGKDAFICATDSTSVAKMDSPMCAVDTALAPNSDNIANWINCLPHEEADGGLTCYAFGGTNVIEYAPNKGLVFFLKNYRPPTGGKICGAGVAKCSMHHGDVPVSERKCDTMWSEYEPYYGDVGIAYNAQDGHVYAYGKGPGYDDGLSKHTFLCKAPADKATDIDAYSYWDASTASWGTQRLTLHGEHGSKKLEAGQAVFGWMAMNQAAPFWSNYFNRWMFLYGNSWGYSDCLVMTAEKLEGPWDGHGGMVVCSTLPEKEGEGFRYACCGHPEFDDSGKSVLVTWTRNNEIYGTTVVWE